jgi:serine protease Do
MDQSFTRGAAVAAFALGTLAAFGPAGAQVTAGAVRTRGDSLVVRVIDSDRRMLDSVMVIMRALDNEPPMSEQAFVMRRRLEELMRALAIAGGRGRPVSGTLMLRAGTEAMRDLESRHVRGWIGINTGNAPHEERSDSSGYFVRYFKYPEIISVEPNSPAQRAGIAPGDVLVAYDGLDVVSRRIDVGQLLVPDRRMEVTVQREGESRDFSLVVAKAPPRIMFRRTDEPGELPMLPSEATMGGFGRKVPTPRRPDQSDRVIVVGPGGFGGGSVSGMPFVIGRSAVFGAALMTVGTELARALKVEKGVLIQECPESTPAYRAGLRIGDAIVSVAGQAVSTAQEVQSLAFAKRNDRSLVIQVMREKKPLTVTVKW